jgi:hypothetical protein
MSVAFALHFFSMQTLEVQCFFCGIFCLKSKQFFSLHVQFSYRTDYMALRKNEQISACSLSAGQCLHFSRILGKSSGGLSAKASVDRNGRITHFPQLLLRVGVR